MCTYLLIAHLSPPAGSCLLMVHCPRLPGGQFGRTLTPLQYLLITWRSAPFILPVLIIVANKFFCTCVCLILFIFCLCFLRALLQNSLAICLFVRMVTLLQEFAVCFGSKKKKKSWWVSFRSNTSPARLHFYTPL